MCTTPFGKCSHYVFIWTYLNLCLFVSTRRIRQFSFSFLHVVASPCQPSVHAHKHAWKYREKSICSVRLRASTRHNTSVCVCVCVSLPCTYRWRNTCKTRTHCSSHVWTILVAAQQKCGKTVANSCEYVRTAHMCTHKRKIEEERTNITE